MITEQERKRRRVTYRLVQLVLVMASIGIVMAFWVGKRSAPTRRSRPSPDFQIASNPPQVTVLVAGDAQIFNVDSTVDLILKGDRIYAGLSPKTVAKVRSEIMKSGNDDSNTIGGMIARTVKEQVADKIDTHVSWDIRDISDIRYENGRIVVDWRSGRDGELFGKVKDVDNSKTNNFRREDAERFIELVKARQRSF